MVGFRAHFAPQNEVNTTAPRHPEDSGHFRPTRVQVLRIPKPRISSGHGAPRCEWFRNGRRCPVSQEQTFLPKLQVYFADFPYSHCSIGLEVLNFGDLLRFPERIRKQSAITEVIFSLKRDRDPSPANRPVPCSTCASSDNLTPHTSCGGLEAPYCALWEEENFSGTHLSSIQPRARASPPLTQCFYGLSAGI